MAIEFDTEEEKKKYQQEHEVRPGTKLTVKEDEKPSGQVPAKTTAPVKRTHKNIPTELWKRLPGDYHENVLDFFESDAVKGKWVDEKAYRKLLKTIPSDHHETIADMMEHSRKVLVGPGEKGNHWQVPKKKVFPKKKPTNETYKFY
jgi:hypothetical protein